MAKKLLSPAQGPLRSWFDWLPGHYRGVEVEQKAGLTAGMRRIGSYLMSKLVFVGLVNKRTRSRPRRTLDEEFATFYNDETRNVEDIPNWRNTQFTGEESYTAFAKYAHDEPVLDDNQKHAVEIAASWMRAEFYPYMAGSNLISAQAVIDGTEGGNSPGFPWNVHHKTCDAFYASCDAYCLGEYWERCVTREGSFTVWNSFLKEELRKIEKIRAGDIRQINGCAVEFKVAMNRFCLEMNEKFYDSHLKTSSAVGLNKFYGGWNRLYHKLARHELGFSFDVKRWDSHFPRVLMEHIRDFRWTCLASSVRTRENRQRFVNLYEQIIESVTVMNWGELLMTKLGNPSGSPNTVVDNTLGLYILVAYAYVRSRLEMGVDVSHGDFARDIVLALYGDDNTFSASDHGMFFLNYSTMAKYGAELGFVVTDGGSALPRPILALEFLSSSFVALPGGMIVSKPKHSEKALASMAFRGDGDPLNTWARACAHRIQSFWDRASYRVADEFCRYLLGRLDAQAEAEGWTVEWQQAKPQYLSEMQLLNLYAGYEGRA